jgi:hypothetical protein
VPSLPLPLPKLPADFVPHLPELAVQQIRLSLWRACNVGGTMSALFQYLELKKLHGIGTDFAKTVIYWGDLPGMLQDLRHHLFLYSFKCYIFR